GQDQIHGFRFADRVRKTLRAADAGNDSKLDLRLPELRVVGGDHDVALHSELAAATKRKARNRRDNRLACLCGGIPVRNEIAEISLDEWLVRHFLDVGSSGEGFVAAGDEHATDLVVGVASFDCLGEFSYQ